MALKQLHLNDGNKTPIEPVISNDSIADNMITLNKLAEPVTTEAEMTLFETNVNNRISALEDNKQANIDGKVTSFKNGTKFTGNLTLSLPNNTDLQVEGKGLKQYITDNIPPSTGGGGGAGVQLSAPNTATNGTITQGQLTTLQESDLNYIIFNNEIYSLNDKTHTADTLTYSHVGFENGKHLLKTISITVSTRAWVLNTTIVNQGGTGGQIPQWALQYFEYSLSDTQMEQLVETGEIEFTANDITSRTNVIKLINYKAGITFQLYMFTSLPDMFNEQVLFKTIPDGSTPLDIRTIELEAGFNRQTKLLTIRATTALAGTNSLGLVAAAPKTSDDTIPVHIDHNTGLLYTAPTSGGTQLYKHVITTDFDTSELMNIVIINRDSRNYTGQVNNIITDDLTSIFYIVTVRNNNCMALISHHIVITRVPEFVGIHFVYYEELQLKSCTLNSRAQITTDVVTPL